MAAYRPSGARDDRTVGDGAQAVLVGSGEQRYLTFGLAGEVYALPILEITEIMEYRPLTVVPMMPAFLRGVINLRGRVVPVVDMAARFGGAETELQRRTSIIIVEVRRDSDGTVSSMGIMVDAVNKVVHLAEGDIEPAPEFGTAIRADFISGMAKYGDGFVIVLDVAHVLTVDEIDAIGQMTNGAEA